MVTCDSLTKSLQFTDSIQEICRPLFENTRIKYFSHCMLSKNNAISVLSSCPNFTRLYIEKKHYNFEMEVLKTFNSSQYILSDFLEFKGKSRELYDDAEQFGLGHFLTVIKKHNDINECFHFAGDIHDKDINSFYMYHRDSIEKFILYYKDRVNSNLLLRSVFEDSRVAFTEENQGYLDFNIDASPAFKFNIDKYVLAINHSVLSRREIECLYWLTHGKTLEEVAALLIISRRTVKAHVENVKKKLNCETLFQLGQAYASLEGTVARTYVK